MRQPVMRHSLLFAAASILVTATATMTANAEKAPAAQAVISTTRRRPMFLR